MADFAQRFCADSGVTGVIKHFGSRRAIKQQDLWRCCWPALMRRAAWFENLASCIAGELRRSPDRCSNCSQYRHPILLRLRDQMWFAQSSHQFMYGSGKKKMPGLEWMPMQSRQRPTGGKTCAIHKADILIVPSSYVIVLASCNCGP